MFQTWLMLSIAALFTWGAWGMFANLATRHLGGFSALVWEVLGAMTVGGIVLVWLVLYQGLEMSTRGAIYGIATGITYTVGLTFFFLALSQVSSQTGTESTGGNIHTIIVLTAMYPVVAVFLNYLFLSEPISLRQMIGMGLGVSGIAILVTT